MITNIKINNFNNMPLSGTDKNDIELNIPLNIFYNLSKPGDILNGDLITDDIVISNDIICKIVNRHDVKDDKTIDVSVKILNKKLTSSCSYFLAEGEIL